MADVFTRTELSFGGAFAANLGLIAPIAGLNLGLLMQNLNISYSQNVTRVYELGTLGTPMNVYYIGGRSQGTVSVGHIIGPKVSMRAYFVKFSDVCEAGTNHLQVGLQAGACKGAGSFSYTLRYCVMVQIGLNVGAQDLVINTQSQIMFSNLEYTEDGALAAAGGVPTAPGLFDELTGQLVT